MLRSLLSIWLNPRKAIVELSQRQTNFTPFKIIFFLAFVFIVGLGISFWFQDLLPDRTKFLTANGIETLFFFLVFLVAALFTFVYLLTLLLYLVVHVLGGSGTIYQTRAAVVWTSLSILPTLFFLFAFISFLQTSYTLLQIGNLFFAFLFLLYSVVILSKMVSEVHQLHFGKALISTLLCLVGACIGISSAFFIVKFLER